MSGFNDDAVSFARNADLRQHRIAGSVRNVLSFPVANASVHDHFRRLLDPSSLTLR